MDAFHTYAGLLGAWATALLLLMIAAFYVSLTMEAFKNASEGRSQARTFRRDGAGRNCRPDDGRLRPAAPPARHRRASAAA